MEKGKEYIYLIYFVFSVAPQGPLWSPLQMSALHIQHSTHSECTLARPPLTHCNKQWARQDSLFYLKQLRIHPA